MTILFLFTGMSMYYAKDKVGMRFGRLEIIARAENRKKKVYWRCKCDCGVEKEVCWSDLQGGKQSSCGCWHSEQLAQRNTKHGLLPRSAGKSPEFTAWINIRGRCYNEKKREYKSYGGRGIKVCDRWLDDDGFVNFLADMGARPTPSHSIDRIDNNGDYGPSNCRWATPVEQANNTRKNRILVVDGKADTLSNLARANGIGPKALRSRLDRGQSHDEAVKTPVLNQTRHITVDGETMTITEAAEKYGINYETLRKRINLGWSSERAVLEPINLKFRRTH